MPRRKVETRPLLAIVQDTITSPDYGERAAREFVANLKDAVERKYSPASIVVDLRLTNAPTKKPRSFRNLSPSEKADRLMAAGLTGAVVETDAQGDLVS